MLKVNDDIILDIKRIGINGEGIGFYERLAVFVPNAIPGEKIKVRITNVLPNMAMGEIFEIKEKSPYRINPICPYYEKCGACNLMHIDYNRTLELKRDLIIEAFNRYTKLNPRSFEIKKTIGCENIYNYRAKSQLEARIYNHENKLGLFKTNTNHFFPLESCMIHNEIVNDINAKIVEIANEMGISFYNSKFRSGIIQNIVTRVSTYNNEAQVTLIMHDKTQRIKDLAKKIIEDISNVVSVYEDYALKEEFEFGHHLHLLEGKKTITESIDGIKFNLSPSSFYQLNPVQTLTLYKEVLRACKLSKKETVLDAYCGVGTISLYLSKLSKKVVGIEISEEAIKDAKENAKINSIGNSDFYYGDFGDVIPILKEKEYEFDVVTLDPPRSGLTDKALKYLLELKPKKIVYVSCNPVTLAKNIAVLCENYQVKYIQPIDMFPNTSHVECVALLSLKLAK